MGTDESCSYFVFKTPKEDRWTDRLREGWWTANPACGSLFHLVVRIETCKEGEMVLSMVKTHVVVPEVVVYNEVVGIAESDGCIPTCAVRVDGRTISGEP